MKPFTFFAASVLIAGTAGWAWCQPAPVPTTIPGETPTTAQVKQRIRHQKARIKADSKVGKLTTDKANQRQSDLDAINRQKKADYAKNGSKELTEDQKADLTQKLDANSQKITSPQYGVPDKPSPASSPRP